MATIEENRRLLAERLKAMSEEGLLKETPEALRAFTPPDDIEEEEETINSPTVRTPVKEERKNASKTEKHADGGYGLEGYRKQFFRPVYIREKTAFTMDVETLRMLRGVLNDLGERVSMASYIDNIIRSHLERHMDMLNDATAKQKRKPTIIVRRHGND